MLDQIMELTIKSYEYYALIICRSRIALSMFGTAHQPLLFGGFVNIIP